MSHETTDPPRQGNPVYLTWPLLGSPALPRCAFAMQETSKQQRSWVTHVVLYRYMLLGHYWVLLHSRGAHSRCKKRRNSRGVGMTHVTCILMYCLDHVLFIYSCCFTACLIYYPCWLAR